MINPTLTAKLANFFQGSERITVLTGAGISAESGIPTFRGPGGIWTVGSKFYQPQEIATYSMFIKKPKDVWKWFLYLRGMCRKANPNPGHLALVAMENLFGDRFTLVTQNVDGLHLRAGNRADRVFQIHGNIDYIRCAQKCTTGVYPLQESLVINQKENIMNRAMWQLLKCPKCTSMARPHALFFDEYYNEEFYRFNSSLQIARQTGLLIIVGSSGATTLPNQIVFEVLSNRGIIIDVNIEKGRFSELARLSPNGYFIQQPAGIALPEIVRVFRELKSQNPVS